MSISPISTSSFFISDSESDSDSPPVKKSRFFASDSDSESESELASEKVMEKAKDPSQIFSEFMENNSPIALSAKKPDPLIKRLRVYIEEQRQDDREMPSPTVVVQSYIKNSSVETLFQSSDGREAVNAYIEAINTAPDSPVRQLRGEYLEGAYQAFSTKLSSASGDTPEYHRESYDNFFAMKAALSDLKKIPCANYPVRPPAFVPIINIPHIVQGEIQGNKCLGYHFQAQGGVNVRIQARNPRTGVVCGTFKLKEDCGEKFSTFFPPSIMTETALIQVIQTAEKIAQSGNRFLYRTRTEIPFYMEKLFQQGGSVIQSAYPLFYYGDFFEGAVFQITENCAISSEEILGALSSPSILEKHIKYVTEDDVIVDIAPLFQEITGVSAGIDFRFPKKLFR